MTWEQIGEGNKLIAEFMGWKYSLFTPFQQDWNDLMYVIERIESIRDVKYGWFAVTIRGNECNIQSEHLWRELQANASNDRNEYPVYISDPNAIFPTKIESTWYNVVEFIKFYNIYASKI